MAQRRIAIKPNMQNNSYSLRIFLLLAGITGVIILLMIRVFHLQIVQHEYWKALASDQHKFEQTILPTRGEIYLGASGTQEPVLAATNITKHIVYAVPKDILDPQATAAKLASALGIPVAEILDKVRQEGNYVVIKKQVDDETDKLIKEMNLIGIGSETESVRYYPEGNLASHVLGFMGYRGDQRVGQYGIEGNFEENLAGTNGLMGIDSDSAGRWITIASRNFVPSQDGDSIYLTIDSAIQHKAQEVLKQAIVEHRAERGSVIVADPKTGAILAMANYPDFDPNEYNKVSDISIYTNSALTADYEPGSVFKPITMSAALNEEAVSPDTTYEDTGVVEMDDFKIKNSDGKANGIQNMTQVLEKSLNTGMVFVEQKLGHKNFRNYVHDFGFGGKTGIELPNEVLGNLDNLEKKGNIFFATASYGQGLTVTPIQLITAYTALANGGKMMKPYIIDKVVHANDKEDKTEPEKIRQVIEGKTAAEITSMLVNVIENGHGKRAAVPGYYLAGKTGTAQVAYRDRVGYDPNKNIGSFIGYGPVDNPRFLMLVRIDHPKNVNFAESTAAPAFGEIASFILNYFQVPPTR
ncbi:MAG: penicillin-binding protein 2 [Candidatus Doudnabacteria bacterium]|nr:penicillin-binding protein 2 [Candidatus Doudnabacteria bacterium]